MNQSDLTPKEQRMKISKPPRVLVGLVILLVLFLILKYFEVL